MNNNVKLFIDCNEKETVKKTFEKKISKFPCSIINCGVGDFHICTLNSDIKIEKEEETINNYQIKIIIERKTWSDYISSLNSGRLARQRAEMIEMRNDVKLVFLIEGIRSKSFRHNSKYIQREAIDKFLISSNIRDNIAVIYTDDLNQSISYIKWIMNQFSNDSNYLESSRAMLTQAERAKKRNKTGISPKECYISQLSMIPGVSYNIAKEVSLLYPSMKQLLDSSLRDRLEVSNKISEIKVGKNKYGTKRALKIIRFIFQEEIEDNINKQQSISRKIVPTRKKATKLISPPKKKIKTK